MFKIFRKFLAFFALFALTAMLHCVVIEPAVASVHEEHEASCMDVGHGDMCCHAHHVLIPSYADSSELISISSSNILSENTIPSVGISADIFRPPRG